MTDAEGFPCFLIKLLDLSAQDAHAMVNVDILLCAFASFIFHVYVFLLSEKYFDMNKKQCKDGLDLYKKFLVRMEKVSEFLKVAEVSAGFRFHAI